MSVSERVLQDLQERKGAASPEDDLMGLVWLKRYQRVACLGLDKALRREARLHKGQDAPAGEPPSAIICFTSGEEDLVAEVESALSVAPNSVVLVLASSPDLRLARAALGAGASGLLYAGMRPEQILRAIRVALGGETVLPRGLLSEWLDQQRPPDLKVLLSTRQRQILELVAEGFTNAEIGGYLYLSESTIKQHLCAAYKSLGVRNRTEAAALSQRYMKLGR